MCMQSMSYFATLPALYNMEPAATEALKSKPVFFSFFLHPWTEYLIQIPLHVAF